MNSSIEESNNPSAISPIDLKKSNKTQIIGLDKDPALIFTQSQKTGYSNSLLSYTIPFFPSDRDKIGKIEDIIDENGRLVEKAKHVYVIAHKNLVIRYHAVAIQTWDGKQEFYFASTNEELVFQSIIDMIGTGEAELTMEGKRNFIVTFRIQALRDYLQKIGKKRSGKVINKALETLERSTVDIEYLNEENREESVSMSGTYLQSATRLKSDNPARNGLYQARLHPHFARDIVIGNYRFIEDQYINASGKSHRLYISILHEMRHKFTNASARKEDKQFSYKFAFSDILFSSGYRPIFSITTARRNIQEIRQLLVKHEVITNERKFKATKIFDESREADDYICEITPSLGWGDSQMKDNYKYNKNTEALKNALEKLPSITN